MEWLYSIEMFKNGKWVKEIRTYYKEKSLDDFDLTPVEGKRRNAQLIKKPERKVPANITPNVVQDSNPRPRSEFE